MSLLERYKGGMALIAAFITSAIGGFPYTWGTISPYFISYQIQHNPSLTPQDFEWVFASVMLGEIIGYAIVPLMQHRFPVKITFLICALPTLLGFGLAWFTFSAHIATLGFGILLGISGGGLHIVSIWPAWSYFEHYKTRLTGILLSFSSIGAGLTG